MVGWYGRERGMNELIEERAWSEYEAQSNPFVSIAFDFHYNPSLRPLPSILPFVFFNEIILQLRLDGQWHVPTYHVVTETDFGERGRILSNIC